jgi:hypothetical protein
MRKEERFVSERMQIELMAVKLLCHFGSQA